MAEEKSDSGLAGQGIQAIRDLVFGERRVARLHAGSRDAPHGGAPIADCILVLDVSRGAHVEVDRISSYPLLAKKMRILLPNITPREVKYSLSH